MINRVELERWRVTAPWQDFEQVEQDLLLSRAICAISNDDLLGNELVFRGGTAFHKLFLDRPLRYSEDLDYVRATAGGIGDIMKRLTAIGRELGFDVRTRMSKYPKVFWRFAYESGARGKIKIEINTYERSPHLPLDRRGMSFESEGESYTANVQTFQPEEQMATKIRAIYQRAKGRDLFDMWVALDILHLAPEAILAAYEPYCIEGTTRDQIIDNLRAKVEDRDYRHDIDRLLRRDAPPYDPRAAADLVIAQLFSKL